MRSSTLICDGFLSLCQAIWLKYSAQIWRSPGHCETYYLTNLQPIPFDLLHLNHYIGPVNTLQPAIPHIYRKTCVGVTRYLVSVLWCVLIFSTMLFVRLIVEPVFYFVWGLSTYCQMCAVSNNICVYMHSSLCVCRPPFPITRKEVAVPLCALGVQRKERRNWAITRIFWDSV